MYRILMYCGYFPPEYSGAAKQAISLARQLRSKGHYIEFVTVQRNNNPATDTYDGFRVTRIKEGRTDRHKEFILWKNLAILAWQKRHDFDFLHSHGAYYTNSIVGPIGRFAGYKSLVKASLAENDLADIGTSVTGSIHKYFLSRVDASVAISRDLEREFRSIGLNRERIHYLPNGVDTELFRPADSKEKATLRTQLGLPTERPVVLSVGVFDQRKNIGWLMDQWVAHNAFGTNAVLATVGPQARDDPDGSFFNGLMKLAGLHSDILFMEGHAEGIERYYRAADAFLLASENEGLPNVMLEAMATALPCIVSQVSGSQDLIKDGETGWLFSPNDVQGLAAGISKALNHKEMKVGEYARDLIEREFSISAIARGYEKLYRALLEGALAT